MSNEARDEPRDFLAELYGDEQSSEDSELEMSDIEDKEQVYNSPSRSPSTSVPADSLLSDRERSRSPLRPPPHHLSDSPLLHPGDILRIYIKEDIPLDRGDGVDGGVDSFLTPDAHGMFESKRDGGKGGRSVRGRGPSRRGRGQPRGRQTRGHRREQQGQLGHPLNEIWVTDKDVPPELVSLATDVVRKRETIAQDFDRDDRNRRVRKRFESGEVCESEDEFEDASAGCDLLEGQNLQFDWTSMESFQCKEEVFRPERTGAVQSHSSAYDAFRSYWDEDILRQIATETNRYASKITSAAFKSDWYPTNSHEILCLFAFWIMLGIIRMPTVASCFSVNPLLKTEIFRRIFTRTRYENLTRALQFVDSDPTCNNSNPSSTGAAVSADRLHSLTPILDHLNSKFKSSYILQKDICIGESLTLWKGELDFKQYIRDKPSKLGIKTFELCESATGYLWSFIVYTGKNAVPDLAQDSTILKSTAVVTQLIGPLLHNGYRLFMDNWYNSPHLARFLKHNGTDCVGILKPSRSDVPVVIKLAPLKRGEIVARHSGDVSILAWQDKTRVTMISTCHGSSAALPRVPSRTPSKPVPFKPQVVLDYNEFKGAVDLKDQMLEPYLLERERCVKWYMKLFKRLLNVSIHNSRILLESSTQGRHDHLSFRLSLVDSILTEHLSQCPRTRSFNVSSSKSSHLQTNGTLHHAHWPVRLGQTEASATTNRSARKRCVVCLLAKRPRKTTFKCESCDVPLCIEDCFKYYHLSSVYARAM